jgi:hypothetical protein
LQNLSEHPDAWPFKEPVDSRDVPDYYDIIKDPIGEFELQGAIVPLYNQSDILFR